MQDVNDGAGESWPGKVAPPLLHAHHEKLTTPDEGVRGMLEAATRARRLSGASLDGGDPNRWTNCYSNDAVSRKYTPTHLCIPPPRLPSLFSSLSSCC